MTEIDEEKKKKKQNILSFVQHMQAVSGLLMLSALVIF